MTSTLHPTTDSSVRSSAPASTRASASGRHLSGASATVGFGRLVAVELRKLIDTRASRWLLIVTFAVAALVLGLGAYIAPQVDPGAPVKVADLINNGIGSLTLLLPVMAIMLAAGEWTQHGALVTFTIEPRRLRVLGAKLLAIVAAAIALCAAVIPLALATAGLSAGLGHLAVDWKVDAAVVACGVAATVLSGVQGFAFGALLMNTPAAIVLYFLHPMALQLLTGINDRVAEVVSWLNTSSAIAPLTQADWSHVHWGKLAVSIGFWVLLPLIAGSIRLVRREVK